MPQTLDDRIVDQSQQEETDRRSSHRMPLPGGTDESHHLAKLRVGSKKIPVKILDESAGGFLVELEGRRSVSTKKPVELISAGTRQMLQVVWAREVDGKTRVGLQRASQHLRARGESSWFIWMLAAIIFGLCLGYIVANRDQGNNLAKRFAEFTGSVVTNQYSDTSIDPSSGSQN